MVEERDPDCQRRPVTPNILKDLIELAERNRLYVDSNLSVTIEIADIIFILDVFKDKIGIFVENWAAPMEDSLLQKTVALNEVNYTDLAKEINDAASQG